MVENGKNDYVAGIVPVAGQPKNFEFEWHDCLMPIAQNYTAVERAVAECAYAGCKTIWLVCNDDVSPLVRHRLGDYIQDPVWLGRKGKHPSKLRRPIPIYYVPVSPKDRDKRDCLSWSIICGALNAFRVSATISKWTIPSHYYVAFPYAVYDPSFLRQYRADIRRGSFFLSHENQTVREGKYLGFTFNADDFIRYRRVLRTGTGNQVPGSDFSRKENLPIHERWSARFFTLDKVFKSAKVEESMVAELFWYYSIDSWGKYCYYLGSGHSEEIYRPSKLMMNFQEFSPVGENR